jgi:sensor c-di-GMP phosphodiesterase-like protein
MWRREKLLIGVSLAAFLGVALVLGTMLWLFWRDSMGAEEQVVGSLALSLGERTEAVLVDTRDLLARLDGLPGPRCTSAHLRVMEEAAATRPYLRAIGHWRAAERLCGVGFLQTHALKPPRADRIYDTGVVAWWPGPHTEVAGVPLFLMRFGDHDAAIDPRMLLDIGPLQSRQVSLWVEHLRMVSHPADASLPPPDDLPVGVTIDRQGRRLVSRFSHDALMPIDVVATEPLGNVWDRHSRALATGSTLGLVMAGGWLFAIVRFAKHRLSLAAELREALAQGRIAVQYQPIVELASGRCVGAEALARWTRGNGESVAPDVFIPIAEQEGLLSTITLAVLDTILRDLGGLLVQSPGLRINLNVSADDVEKDTFGHVLAERLAAAQLPSAALTLEITERALVNSVSALQSVRSLRERGHQIAIDDFGTGYSSLSYLESFDVDVLKIDKTFVHAIGTTAASGQVIGHVIDMARSLGLRTVAEGIETESQHRWLADRGVDFGQGYWFSRPLGASAFRHLLQAKRAA